MAHHWRDEKLKLEELKLRQRDQHLRPGQILTTLLLTYHEDLFEGVSRAESETAFVQLPTGQGKGEILGIVAAFRYLMSQEPPAMYVDFFGAEELSAGAVKYCSAIVVPTEQLLEDAWNRNARLFQAIGVETEAFAKVTEKDVLGAEEDGTFKVDGKLRSLKDLRIALLTDATLMTAHLMLQKDEKAEQSGGAVLPWMQAVADPIRVTSTQCLSDESSATIMTLINSYLSAYL